MKIRYIVLIVLITLLLKCVFNLLVLVPDLITLASKKAVATDAIVIDRDADEYTVFYATKDGSIISKVKCEYFSNQQKGNTIPINYDVDNPSRILCNINPFISNGFWSFVICYILTAPIFSMIYDDFKSKKWDKAEYEFVSSKPDGNTMYYTIEIAREIDGKKKIETLLSDSSLISTLINSKILEKVPVRINPNNRKKIIIDREAILKVVSVNKSWIQI